MRKLNIPTLTTRVILFPVAIPTLLLTVACQSIVTSEPPTAKSPPTATQVRTPTPTSTPITIGACVKDQTIRIRTGPGTDYEVTDGLVSGACMTIVGRNQDASWVYMVSEDNKTGWVAAWLLAIDVNITSVPIQTNSQLFSQAPSVQAGPTKSLLDRFNNSNDAETSTAWINPFVSTKAPEVQAMQLCSQTENQIGEYVTCRVERAYCDYRPRVNGSPTFCNDRPYPGQNFVLVVWGEDWSEFDGACIDVSGQVYLYQGVLQIEGLSRSQVSYCN